MRKSVSRRVRGWFTNEWVLVIAITTVAAILRLIALDRLPPGLYHDEGYNGLDALGVLDGRTPLFFPANNGREPLYIYLLAASVALLGPTPSALRVVSALLGTLTVPLTYWLGRETLGRRAGAVAAWLAAVTVWTVNLSRIGFRAVSALPLTALALTFLWQGLNQRRIGRLAVAGITYGLVFYTYLAARFTVVALLLLYLYLLVRHRRMAWFRGWLVFGLAALLIASPLAIHMLTNWSEMVTRAGQVSILNPAVSGGDVWGTLAGNILRAAGLFVWRGDSIPRHNVPLRPVFDPLLAIALLGGVITAIRRARQDAACALVLVWVGVMLVPTILAEDTPHMLRASGVLPIVYLLPALGLATFRDYITTKGRPALASVVVALVLLIGPAEGLFQYAKHLSGDVAYWNFETAATDLASTVNTYLGVGWQGSGWSTPVEEAEHDRLVYVAPRLWDGWPSVRYLCDPADRLGLVSSEIWPQTTASTEDVMLVVWPFEDYASALSLLPATRLIVAEEGSEERGDLETESRLLYLTISTFSPDSAPRNASGAWEEGISLWGYEVTPLDNGTTAIDLYWHADSPPGSDYTVFVHLLDDGILLTQHDGPAANGYYPTTRWRPGDLVRDRHILPGELPREGTSLELRVGLYRWDTLEHLRRIDDSGQPTSETALCLEMPKPGESEMGY